MARLPISSEAMHELALTFREIADGPDVHRERMKMP